MPDLALQNALYRHSEISIALEKIASDLSEVSDFLTKYHRFSDRPPPAAMAKSDIDVAKPSKPSSASPKRVDPLVLKSVQEARTIIGSLDRPVPLGELFEAVKAKGYRIETANAIGTFSGRLRDQSRRVGLISIRGFGWWLKERPYSPASYSPATSTRHRRSAG